MDPLLRLKRLIDGISAHPEAATDGGAALHQILEDGDAFFVQIGAQGGQANDPLIGVIQRNARLRGLLITPLAQDFERLCELHRHRLGRLNILQAGIADTAKRMRLLSGDAIDAVELDAIPLSEVTANARFPVIDALVIDTPGQALDVLKGANLSSQRPRFVLYADDIGNPADIDSLLSRHGYRWLCGGARKLFYDLSAFRPTGLRLEGAGAPRAHSGLRLVHRVVSTCIERDIEVWKVAAPQIMSCIAATHYEVVVPDAQVALFTEHSPPNYRVTPESRYGQGWDVQRVAALLPATQQQRAGWYWQQLLKLQACRDSERPEDVVLIWDADTVPLANLRFVTPEGQLIYRPARENHAPYFRAIERLLGLPKQVNVSFIAQCFPTRSHWVRAMAAAIEARHGMHYFEAILRCSESQGISGFSEYETLGNYAFVHFNEEMVFTNAAWVRQGKAMFGSLENFARIAQLDYVVFESWE